MPPKRVLTVDGGGTCGFFSHQILRKLDATEWFNIDLVVGVSAGAIVGAALACGLLSDLDDTKVQSYMSEVFGDMSSKGPWFGPKYKGETKTEVLRKIFRDTKFGDVSIPMVIIVDRIHNSPVLCRSWDPTYRDISLVRILDATSAVPVLFPPVSINGEQYIDGGTVTSTPICVGHLAALELFASDEIYLLSLGTQPRKTQESHRFNNEDMGIVQLLSLGLPVKVLTQNSSLFNELSINILRQQFFRIEGNVSASIDDTSIYSECKQTATSVWLRMESSIKSFICHVD